MGSVALDRVVGAADVAFERICGVSANAIGGSDSLTDVPNRTKPATASARSPMSAKSATATCREGVNLLGRMPISFLAGSGCLI